MFTIILYSIPIGLILIFVYNYLSIREGLSSSKINTEDSPYEEHGLNPVLMSMGAFLIPVLILILSNTIYVRLRGDAIGSHTLDYSLTYYKYDEIAEIISLFFSLVAFMYFVILYDRRKRKNRGNSLLISFV